MSELHLSTLFPLNTLLVNFIIILTLTNISVLKCSYHWDSLQGEDEPAHALHCHCLISH